MSQNTTTFVGVALTNIGWGLIWGGGLENIFKDTFGSEGCVLPEDARVPLQAVRLMHD